MRSTISQPPVPSKIGTSVTGPSGVRSPEKPRHIDERIDRIGTDDLIAAFGRPSGVHDLGALRRFVSAHSRRPAWPLIEWASAVRGTAGAERLIAEAAPLLGEVDVTGAAHGRSRRYGFHYLNWLSAGVRAWLVTGEDAYLRAFERHFDAWVDQRDSVTGEWPGLDVIWYSLGTWARCRNLLPMLEVLTDSDLSDRTWGRVMATLVGGARWAFDEHDAFRHGNWQLVSATELMHIGAVLPHLSEADAWARRGRERVDEHLLLDVYRDGGHYERSPGYHMMCLSALHLAAVVDARCGSGDLAGHPKLVAMHAWLRDMTSTAGWTPHLQDSHVEWPARTLLRGSYVLGDPALAWAAREWISAEEFAEEAAMLPVWEDPQRRRRWERTLRDAGTASAPAPALTTVLPDSGYAILRSREDPDALRAVINFGPHIEHELESHSHRAVLDFTLEGWGQPLLWEAGGPPSYDDPDYLSWFQSGRGHNTVLVDGQELEVDRESRSDGVVEVGPVVIFGGRHRGNRLAQARRLIMVREEPSFLIVDDRASIDEPGDRTGHTFQLRLHALHPWEQTGPLAFRTTQSSGPGLRAVELGDPEATVVGFGEGRARRPNLATRTAEYGPLYSLLLDRAHGDFTTVLLPSPGAEPRPATARLDGGAWMVDHGTVVDRVEATSWVRTSLVGPARAPGTEVLRWACGWGVRELSDRGVPLFASTVDVDVAVLTAADSALRVVVDAPSRCRIRIDGRAADPAGAVRVEGVPIMPSPSEAGGDRRDSALWGPMDDHRDSP